jgi:hypothetical protein
MSSSNSNIGLSLVTLATGNAIANISTTVGYAYDGSTSKLFISPNCSYSEITTASGANNAYTLPFNPIVGQTYTVKNDSTVAINIYPGTSISQFQVDQALLTAGASYQIPTGGSVTFECIQNNNALNTQSGTNAFNNPYNVYHIIQSSLPNPQIVSVVAGSYTANAYTVTAGQSGTTFLLGAPGANSVINLPAVTNCAGVNYKFIATATLANTVAITAQTNCMCGSLLNGPNTGVTAVYKTGAGATATMTATALKSDFVQVSSDGTNWYCFGVSQANAGLS